MFLTGAKLRVFPILFGFVAIFLLSSCTTLSQRVTDLTKSNYYKQALTQLQKEDQRLQQSPDAKGLDELKRSQEIYEASVRGHYLPLILEQEQAGNTYGELKVIEDSLLLCDWSQGLLAKKTEILAVKASIEVVQAKWSASIQKGSIALESIEELKSDLYPLKGHISDAPLIGSLNTLLQSAILERVTSRIQSTNLRMSQEEFDHISSDIRSIENNKSNEEAVVGTISTIFRIINGSDSDRFSDTWKSLYRADLEKTDSPTNQRLLGAVKSAFEYWIVTDFGNSIATRETSPASLDIAESYLAESEALKDSGQYLEELSKGHLLRSQKLNHGGFGSLLSKIHINRARVLAPNLNSVVRVELEKANALLSKTELPRSLLVFNINPTLPKDEKETIFANYFSDFLSHSRKGQPWTFDEKNAKSVVKVTIDYGKLIFPNQTDLMERVSTYFDHYENVPNPYKETLKFQLSMQESSVNQAKSTYDWSVSSYNISPSDFGLSQVNNNYNSYQQAINDYNRLVNQYNNTPSLIQHSVFLPYTYREGYWEMGYTLTVSIDVNGKKKQFSSRSVDRAFVKLGTRYNDFREDNRTDVRWKYTLTVDNFLAHVNRVNSEIDREVYQSLSQIETPTTDEISSAEQTALNQALIPWGFDPSRPTPPGLAPWMVPILADPTLVDSRTSLPTIKLQPALEAKGRYQDSRALVADLGETVVLVENFANSEIYSTGSGTLIGPDGLILTCAHVLSTPDVRIVASLAGKAQEFPVEVVFSNEKNDLALLRAPGLANKKWANIRLQGTTSKGDRLVAIGNPSLGGSLLNLGGVTQGIVSNPSLDDNGQTRLVGDITVASGSSGGPLFSAETGELVGVVQAVTQMGLNNGGVSSSGYFALGAPSQRLTEWLGIKYQ